MSPDKQELRSTEGKFANFVRVHSRPLRTGLAMTALFSGPVLAACTSSNEVISVPPIVETIPVSPPPVPEVRQPYEQEASPEQRQALVESLSQFVNEGYLQKEITFEWSEFDSDINRTSAMIHVGNQEFWVANHYERNTSEGKLRTVGILPNPNKSSWSIDFDEIPGRPFSKSDFDTTPDNIKALMGVMFKLPTMEWVGERVVSSPLSYDVLRGVGQDPDGKTFGVEVVSNNEQELQAYFGEPGLGGVSFTSLWVNYQPNQV